MFGRRANKYRLGIVMRLYRPQLAYPPLFGDSFMPFELGSLVGDAVVAVVVAGVGVAFIKMIKWLSQSFTCFHNIAHMTEDAIAYMDIV